MDLQEMDWKKNPFYFDKTHPFLDFNKEIIRPRQHFECRHGGVIIRADENFWQVAFLPYKFHKLSIQDIVQTLWPQKWSEAEFGEDVEYAGATHEGQIQL